MRLLNTTTLALHEFYEDEVPQYAILSHRWGSEETSYKDYSKGRNKESAGYRKIVDFCGFAKTQGHTWVWKDTCCIDKRSSAELSEAINSMWYWYRDAQACYVFLADVPWTGVGEEEVLQKFKRSEWFTRGWCLQELLAPPDVMFCNSAWEAIGTKHSLAPLVSTITGVPQNCLTNPQAVVAASVAAKMSWAAHRKTARSEDMAYCLLGLFGAHIPLLYGEGGKAAFYRLQLAIVANSDDESLFSWQRPLSAPAVPNSSMFAGAPIDFVRCGRFEKIERIRGFRPPYAMTNKGLDFQCPEVYALPKEYLQHFNISYSGYIIALNCRDELEPSLIVLEDFSLAEKKASIRRVRRVRGVYSKEELEKAVRKCKDVGPMHFYIQ